MFCLYRFTYLSYQYGLFHQYKKRHTPAATESANYCFYETIPSLTLIITLASVDLKYNYEGQDNMKETTRLFHAMLMNIELLFAVSG